MFPERVNKFIGNTIMIVTFYVIRMLSSFIRLAREAFIGKQEGGQGKLKQPNGIMLILNVIIWSVGLLFLVANLRCHVTTIIARWGIGGIERTAGN